jgi:hypothetical protein
MEEQHAIEVTDLVISYQKGNKHFESINAHSDYDKYKFRYIYFGNDRFITFNYPYTL